MATPERERIDEVSMRILGAGLLTKSIYGNRLNETCSVLLIIFGVTDNVDLSQVRWVAGNMMIGNLKKWYKSYSCFGINDF